MEDNKDAGGLTQYEKQLAAHEKDFFEGHTLHSELGYELRDIVRVLRRLDVPEHKITKVLLKRLLRI